MSTTLYVSDLDGTLLSSESVITPASRAMLNEAISAGANFTVATARTPATVSTLLEGVDMRLPAVVMTGAALWDSVTGHYSDICPIPAATVARMMEIYRRHDHPTFVYQLKDDLIHIYHYGEMSAEERQFLEERIVSPLKRWENVVCDPDGMPSGDDPTLLFYAMRPPREVAEVRDEVRRLPVTVLNYYDLFGPEISILEVFGPNTSKANAVRRLADRIGAGRIVAFGDNLNDLPLLRMADVGVAVGNAVEEVLAEADVTIGTNDTDAVARFILNDIRK